MNTTKLPYKTIIIVAACLGLGMFLAGGLCYFLTLEDSDAVPRSALLDADHLTMTRHYDKSAILIDRAIQTYGRQPELLLRMGCVESMLADSESSLPAKEKKFSSARAYLQEAQSLSLEDPIIEWNIALLALRESVTYREAGREEAARAKLDEFTVRTEKVRAKRDWQPGIDLHLGRIKEMDNDWETAADHYIAEFNNIPDRAAAFHALMSLRADHPAERPRVPVWFTFFGIMVVLALGAAGIANRMKVDKILEEESYE